MYKVADFDYHLPPSLIAQTPAEPRDSSRLLLLDRKSGAIKHEHFYDLPESLRPGDLLVLNNSKVFPARLIGHKAATGGAVEIFLHRPLSGKGAANIWECLVGGRVRPGLVIDFPKKLRATLMKDNDDGTWQVRFNQSGRSFWKTVDQIGLTPLPPYIKRDRKRAADKNRYQTVFADPHRIGSAAAPTAGLHFTKSLLKRIRARGVKIAYVTLHVGLGTFAPVKAAKISEHKMHSEFAAVPAVTIKAVLAAKAAKRRVIAVGTTSCRTLESLDWKKFKAAPNKIFGQSFWTDIFIHPGYRFRAVDALVTNFHLPKSTLLMLVAALAGKSKIDKAYQTAVRRGYRFFSYGDAMFIC